MDHGPFKIRLLRRVRSEIPGSLLAADAGEHEAWCNQHGAVSVKPGVSGRWLGIKPDEFEYLTPPPSGVPLAVTGEGARKLMDQLMDTEERLAELLYHVSGLSERGYTAKGMKEAADDHMDRQFGYRLDDAVKDAGLPDELQVHHLGSLLERLKADPEVGNNQPEGEALSEAIDFINAIRAAAADGVKA